MITDQRRYFTAYRGKTYSSSGVLHVMENPEGSFGTERSLCGHDLRVCNIFDEPEPDGWRVTQCSRCFSTITEAS